MKKFISFFAIIAMFAVIFTACQKSDDVIVPQNKLDYLKTPVALKLANTDLKKAAPAIAGYTVGLYMGSQGSYSLVNKDQFLPNSDPYNHWSNAGNNPKWFTASSSVQILYWPVAPTRVVVKALATSSTGTPIYMGIHDQAAPTADGFTPTVRNCRLGDFLAAKNGLKNYRGFANMVISLSYTKSIIDLDKTIQSSPNTDSDWLQYVYQPTTVSVVDQVLTGDGDVVLYEGPDAKITGTIYVKLTINGQSVTLQTPATSLGNGLVLEIVSEKLDYDNSGNLNLTNCDFKIERRQIKF